MTISPLKIGSKINSAVLFSFTSENYCSQTEALITISVSIFLSPPPTMAPHHLLPQPPPLRPASNCSSIAAPDADQDSGSHVLPNLPSLPSGGGGGMPPGADALAEQFKKFYSSSYYASLQQAAAVVAATASAANGSGGGGAAAVAAAAADPMSTFADAEEDGEFVHFRRGALNTYRARL